MIDKLQRWAWIGGALLAVNAGLVNAVGLQSYAHQAVTHVTGTTTLFSLALAQANVRALAELAGVVLCFAGGAALSGFIIRNQVLQLGRRYGAALVLESVLLALAAWLMNDHVSTGSYVASTACGLQNAMASTYSGAVLRTTHISGMVTDLGAAAGHFLRGAEVDWIRVRLYIMLISSFVIGGVVGSLLYLQLGNHTLYIPAALTGGVAIAYSIYAHWKRVRRRQPA